MIIKINKYVYLYYIEVNKYVYLYYTIIKILNCIIKIKELYMSINYNANNEKTTSYIPVLDESDHYYLKQDKATKNIHIMSKSMFNGDAKIVIENSAIKKLCKAFDDIYTGSNLVRLPDRYDVNTSGDYLNLYDKKDDESMMIHKHDLAQLSLRIQELSKPETVKEIVKDLTEDFTQLFKR